MSFHYYKWALIVNVSETVGGKFEVDLLDPDDHRPVASKKFKRGADPSVWIGKQMGKRLPKWIADYHKVRNDDPRPEPRELAYDRHSDFFDGPYDDWRY